MSSMPLFLELKHSGASISLLSYTDAENRNHFFIQQDNQLPIELIYHKYFSSVNGERTVSGRAAKGIIEVKKYIGQLNYYLQDCATIGKKINLTKYNNNSLIDLFIEYEICKGGTTEISQKTEKAPKYFSLFGGINASFLNFKFDGQNILFNGLSESSPFVGIGPNLGFAFSFGTKGKFDLINYYIKGNYYMRRVSSSYEYLDDDVPFFERQYKTDYNFTSHFLDFSIGFGFHFLHDKNVKPYIKVLATSHLVISEKSIVTEEIYLLNNLDDVTTTMPAVLNNSDNATVWTITPTLTFGVFIKNLFVEASFLHNYKGHSKVIVLNDKESHLFLNMGYRLKLGKQND